MVAVSQPSPPDSFVLPPWVIVRRLRPITLKAAGQYVRHHARMVAALRLLERTFPDEVGTAAQVVKVDPTIGSTVDPTVNPTAEEIGAGWWEVMAQVANLAAKADWFAVNWDGFNDAWAWWVERGDNGDRLAVFLEYIPVKMFGFGGEMLFECPPMELLHALFAPATEVNAISAQLLERAGMDEELDAVWFEVDRESAWELLHTIESQPDQFPEPVRWLPELTRWACRRTGNVLLDERFDPYGHGPWYRWDGELPRIQNAWQRARPVLEVLQRVLVWVDADPHNLPALAHFLMRGGSTDRLNW